MNNAIREFYTEILFERQGTVKMMPGDDCFKSWKDWIKVKYGISDHLTLYKRFILSYKYNYHSNMDKQALFNQDYRGQ